MLEIDDMVQFIRIERYTRVAYGMITGVRLVLQATTDDGRTFEGARVFRSLSLASGEPEPEALFMLRSLAGSLRAARLPDGVKDLLALCQRRLESSLPQDVLEWESDQV